MSNKSIIKWPVVAVVLVCVAILLTFGILGLKIDTDILSSLPQDDPIISNASYVLKNHPMQDQVVIDMGCENCTPDELLDAAILFEKGLEKSDLFKEIGMTKLKNIFPDLISHIINNLPVLFSKKELDEKIKPILEGDGLEKVLRENVSSLLGIGGIGQSEFIINDPLSLRNLVLAKLSHLAPTKNGKFYRDHLLSSDSKHLLVVVKPHGSGTDTTFAKKAADLFDKLSKDLDDTYLKKNKRIILTPIGAFRAALDNERTAKSDTERAIIFATIGIILLLLFTFPRPYLGILSLIPAFVGTITSFFVFSLFYDSISLLTIGFGGAIISITVDHGIAYLLFLDQTNEVSGRAAAREVWSVGILATLTTMGAFLSLFISGFKILEQLGLFASMGIAFSFIFVHGIFPKIIPLMPPAKKTRSLPIHNLVKSLALKGGKIKLIFSAVLFVFMLFYSKPEFNVNLNEMNTVSDETIEAEKNVSKVWGNVLNKIFVLSHAENIDELRIMMDTFQRKFQQEVAVDNLKSMFVPSVVFPGKSMAVENYKAWRNFWDYRRTNRLIKNTNEISQGLGLPIDVFSSFYNKLKNKHATDIHFPEKFYPIMGVSKAKESSQLLLFSSLVPGKNFNSQEFYNNYTEKNKSYVFDPAFFSNRFGELLSSTFIRMVIIIGISIIILLFVFFCDWKLTVISVLPIIFAFICTLGTLKLFGRALDIPSLMLSIIILGMGIDYSLYFVRSYQRYIDENHSLLSLIRIAIFLASGSTLIGFGSLCFAEHSLLKSAGVTCLLGIGYSLLGAFLILPPVLKNLFVIPEIPSGQIEPGSREHLKRIMRRCRHIEAYPRLFTKYKIKFDPMFSELHELVGNCDVLLDIGTGYGVPAMWLLEIMPGMKVYGIEADYERARVANRLIGTRGSVIHGHAPDMPESNIFADCAIMIDMLHYLNNDQLGKTVTNVYNKLKKDSKLILRCTFPSEKRFPWLRWFEKFRTKLLRQNISFQKEEEIVKIITGAGFKFVRIKDSLKTREEKWLVFIKK